MHTRPRPNVIWIFGDQHPAHMMSRHLNPNLATPHLDTLAEYGVDFVRAVATCPLCCPARGTLLTGRYPDHAVPGHNWGLPDNQTTLAHVFAEAGYDTAYFGKWHLRGHRFRDAEGNDVPREIHRHPSAPEEPKRRECHNVVAREHRGGFGTWIGYENNNAPTNTWVHGHRGEDEVDLHRLPGFETDALTDLLLEYLQEPRDPDSPFFAVLSVQPPHDPYVGPPEFHGRHSPALLEMRPNVPEVERIQQQARQEYAGALAMVENLDWNVGRVREALVELGLDTDTLLFFFSDHGDMHGSQGQFRKTNPYTESVHIPCLLAGGLEVQGEVRGIDSKAPIGLVDLAPTTLGLCGIEPPEWMEGYDFSAIKSRREPRGEAPHEALICLPIPTEHADSTDKRWYGIVTDDGYKYVCLEGREWLMFNLNEDPHEQVNLAHNSRFKTKRHELNERLRARLTALRIEFELPDC